MECHLLVLWEKHSNRSDAGIDDCLFVGKKKRISILYIQLCSSYVFDFKSVNLPHYRAIGRGRYVLSLFMDIPGLIDCRMGGIEAHRKNEIKNGESYLCCSYGLSDIPVFWRKNI